MLPVSCYLNKNYFFQSSQIASFLSFCDFYRPKRLIMENMRNFLPYENSVVLKLTFRSLLKLGYQVMIKCIITVSTYKSQKNMFLVWIQCTFGVLQCGNYGIPKADIVLSSLVQHQLGQVLPMFPEPRHCFSPYLSVAVDNKKVFNWGLLIEIINKECVLGHNHVPLFLMCDLMNRPYRI